MKLLDNLEGVTPSTFPKNPIGIVNEIVQQQKCKYVFGYRTEQRQAANTADYACGACVDEDDGVTLYHGIGSVKGPTGKLVAVSEEKTAGSRRAVRSRCSEQVLLRMHHDKDYLQRAIDEVKSTEDLENGGAASPAP